MLISKLEKSHDRKSFDCGNVALNRYIKQLANQTIKRNEAVIYVAYKANDNKVIGYYTLSTCHIEKDDDPLLLKKQSPHGYIPCVLLGRLAVDKTQQGKGLGSNLLLHAMKTVKNLSEIIGVAFIVVDAKDNIAKSFYQNYGFMELTSNPMRLCYPISKIY